MQKFKHHVHHQKRFNFTVQGISLSSERAKTISAE